MIMDVLEFVRKNKDWICISFFFFQRSKTFLKRQNPDVMYSVETVVALLAESISSKKASNSEKIVDLIDHCISYQRYRCGARGYRNRAKFNINLLMEYFPK